MKVEINRLKGVRVMVVGDLMLDTYHIGSVKRISPEAPVPVIKIDRSYSVLGGAANVARNLVGLGAKPTVVGVIGDDNNGGVLRNLFSELDIETILCHSDAPTTTKTRIIGNDQQVARIDFEECDIEIPSEIYEEAIRSIESRIEDMDIVVISDYNKGVCSEDLCRRVIDLASRHNKMVVVDPKGTDWSKYSNATIITPNIKELSDVANQNIANQDIDVEQTARKILKKYNLESLLVTRSEKGMSYVSPKQSIIVETEAREVFDVSGAGDTVVATLAASLAAGFSISDSIFLANKAAGVVVGKMGTSPILFQELRTELFIHCSRSKVITAERLSDVIYLLHEKKSRIVFTNGCFDILHRGHVDYLDKAKNLGDVLILGLNSDASVRRLKGESRPINNEEARATVMAALNSVDYVVIFDEDTPLNLIKTIRPNILVKGGDYSLEDIVGREYAEFTTTIPFVEGFSTTETIKKMKS